QALNQADFVGDSRKDIEAARAANANPVLVLTGNGKRTRETLENSVETFQDLADYADFKLTM
ncbi:MAG: HAD hydrolase-like protein, partial [Gammaproteobacteria bacterium]|nr:HAD hydrolase-like protein [Gammaproteobacteria bacterium]